MLVNTHVLCLNSDTNKWSVAESKGDTPAPRSGATMATVGDKLYLFGGLSRETGWFDELFMFDTGEDFFLSLFVSYFVVHG